MMNIEDMDLSSGESSDSGSEMVMLYNARLAHNHDVYLLNRALDSLVEYCIRS